MKRALVLVWICACQPGPLDEVGTRCSTERPCSAPLFCVAGRCSSAPGPDGGSVDAGAADGGVDAGRMDAGEADAGGEDSGFPVDLNLLRNPGFESSLPDGSVPFWSPSGGALAPSRVSRTGMFSARISRVNLNNNPALQSASAPGSTAFAMLFCASAWVRHEEPELVSASLTVRERFPGGNTNASNGNGGRFDAGLWVKLSESLVTFGGGTSMDVRVSTTGFPPDASLFVDDVQLIRASGTTCP